MQMYHIICNGGRLDEWLRGPTQGTLKANKRYRLITTRITFQIENSKSSRNAETQECWVNIDTSLPQL